MGHLHSPSQRYIGIFFSFTKVKFWNSFWGKNTKLNPKTTFLVTQLPCLPVLTVIVEISKLGLASKKAKGY